MSAESLWQRLTRGARRLWQRPDWARFAGPDWADRIMDRAVTDQFHAKQGRSTGRLVLEARGKKLVVYLKRYHRLPRWRGLLAALWPGGAWSPALTEWRHLEWAHEQGLPVPSAVAAGDFWQPWGRMQGFLAIEELTGMLALHEAIPAARARLEVATFRRWKHTLIHELARLAHALHDQHWFHKDFYLCHFFIPEEDTRQLPSWRGRVHVIDLHRLARHHLSWPVWLVKDLAQLLYSSEIFGVDASDRVRFWRAYLGTARRTWMGRLMRRVILFKWQQYRRHNARNEAQLARAADTEGKAA